MCFSLCISCAFDPATTSELLDVLALSCVPLNLIKKFILFFGPAHVGKSYMTDLLMEYHSPHVGRFNDLEAAQIRAGVTTKNNATIINEVSKVNSETMKSVTGNDAESVKQFFSQDYIMRKDQSLIFGATNNEISFVGTVDRATINRLHVITLKGSQDPKQELYYSYISHLTLNKYLLGIVNIPQKKAVRILSFLMLSSYMKRRDQTMKPFLDPKNPSAADYRNRVYANNNPLIFYLTRCGIEERTGFFMPVEQLTEIVKRDFGKKTFTSMSEFEKKFFAQYNVQLERVTMINDLQLRGLIYHIVRHMNAIVVPEAIITLADIESRIDHYSNKNDRANAKEYFKNTYASAFDYKLRVYKNLQFELEPMSYEGNSIDAEPTHVLDAI